MAQLRRRIVISSLKGKGFVRIPDKRNDLWFALTIDGDVVPEVKTFISGGGKKPMIYEHNIHKMVHELHMDNKKQFIDYIHCPYTYSEYIEDLRQKEII
ncbi:MAG: hypothetical protein ACFFG0_48675 [Candidatus Thorarchaeota archaeon]